MNEYEAKYVKSFEGRSAFRGDPIKITASEKLAILIDNDWKHSWHWPSDHNEWVAAVKKSLESEKENALARLDELRQAERIIASITLTGEE
jgi:hypothetical protein